MRNVGYEPYHCWQPTSKGFALVGEHRSRESSVLVLDKPIFEALEACADDNDVYDERRIIVSVLEDHLCEEGYLTEEEIENWISEVSD
jgi:hypothetical protein